MVEEMCVSFQKCFCVSIGWRMGDLGCGKSRKRKFTSPTVKAACRISDVNTRGTGLQQNDSLRFACEPAALVMPGGWVCGCCSGGRTTSRSSGKEVGRAGLG